MRLEAVLVGPQDHFFDPVEAAVIAKGHKVARYKDTAKFLQQQDPLANADVLYAVGYLPVSREMMAKATRLRAVISPWTGTEGFDEPAATALGIVVGNGQVPANTESMAEATILLILTCLYDVKETERRLSESRPNPAELAPRMLKGKTIGLIGYGRIAQAITARLAGWDVEFLAVTPRPPAQAQSFVRFVALDEVLGLSDVLCVLAPLTSETRNLLNAERLAATKPGSVIINTSRGGVIDEAALHELMVRGHFSSAALDVFETEPLPMDSPLRGIENAVLTPHCVGHTRESRLQLVEAGVANVLRVLEGRPPICVRNPEILEAWQGRWSAAVP